MPRLPGASDTSRVAFQDPGMKTVLSLVYVRRNRQNHLSSRFAAVIARKSLEAERTKGLSAARMHGHVMMSEEAVRQHTGQAFIRCTLPRPTRKGPV